MNCAGIEERLSGLLDGELAPEERAQVETHLSACADCRKILSDLKGISAIFKDHIPREQASHHLKERVFERLRLENIESLLEGRPLRRFLLRTSLVGAVACATAFFLFWRQPPAVAVAQAAIFNHINSLSGKLPVEVRDRDPQTIGGWFVGKLPFRVEVPDLTREGYRFVGGRLCHLNGLDVAYITYKQKDGRKLSLFVVDSSKTKFPAKTGHRAVMSALKGYRAACWRKDGLGYILVSDLNEKELQALAEKVRRSLG